MKPEIEMYFQDPTEFVTKCARQYMQVGENTRLIYFIAG